MNNNLTKEIFNQFLIDTMEDKMLIPNENGILKTEPKKTIYMGVLLPNIRLNEKLKKSNQYSSHMTGASSFDLDFKIKNFNKIKSNFSYYLYIKQYPDFKQLKEEVRYVIKDEFKKLKNEVRKNLRKEYEDSGAKLENDLAKEKGFNEEVKEKFKKKLKETYNKNNDSPTQTLLNYIVEFLDRKQLSYTKSNEEIISSEEEENEIEEENSFEVESENSFLINKEEFSDTTKYNELIEKLKDETFHNKFFSNIVMSLNYKLLKIDNIDFELDLSKIKDEQYQNSINHEINSKIYQLVINKIKTEKIKIPKQSEISSSSIGDINAYENYLNKQDNFITENKISIPIPEFKFSLDNNNLNIKLTYLSNQKENALLFNPFDIGIYNLNLEMCFDVQTFEEKKFNSEQKHYKYNYGPKIFCSTKNIAITSEQQDDGNIKISTTWLPKYYLPKNENRSINHQDKLLEYNYWSLDNKKEISNLSAILDEYNEWIENISSEIKINHSKAYQNDKDNWLCEINKIEQGIRLLVYSQECYKKNLKKEEFINFPYIAWCLLNQSFNQEKISPSTNNPGWRLFQVAFVLTLVLNVSLRIEGLKNILINDGIFKEEELNNYIKNSNNEINLLYFSAGGGKTEAFLGVLLFNLFIDRLRGKYCGLTSIIKYPLRLLLLQQSSRVLKSLSFAEKVRREYFKKNTNNINNLFDESFSLGIWVGEGGTPNSMRSDRVKAIFKLKNKNSLNFNNLYTLSSEYEYLENETDFEIIYNKIKKEGLNEKIKDEIAIQNHIDNESELKKIDFCPYCNEKKIILRQYNNSLVHICCNKNCYWNQENNHFCPLPFYIVDDDLYTKYPSVVISTTDKLATFGLLKTSNDDKEDIPNNQKLLGMFGVAPYYDSEQKRYSWKQSKKNDFLTLYPFDRKSPYIIKDGFPSLIIQDETHLLVESLGSFSAVFERIFNSVSNEIKKIYIKNNLFSNAYSELNPIILAATATISSPEKQLIPIYNREKVSLFPASGYKIYENFYSLPIQKTRTIKGIEKEDYAISRIYVGFFINSNNYLSSIKRFSFEYHNLLNFIYLKTVNQTLSKEDILNGIKSPYYKKMFSETYQELNQDEFLNLININLNYNKILINYANSKNDNDKLKHIELTLFEKQASINSSNPIIKNSNQELITSEVSPQKLAEILTKIKEEEKEFVKNKDTELIRSIFATKSISHGVDSESFNAMSFHGFPEMVNEYIQASARIGRTNVGFVACFPKRYNAKDQLIMNNFEAFHRFIDRPVLSTKIDFKTDVIFKRAILSLLIAWFMQIYIMNSYLSVDKPNILSLSNLDYHHFKNKTKITKEFKDYIVEFYGETQSVNDILAELFSNFKSEWSLMHLQNIGDNDIKYTTMKSLRDTEETIQINIIKKG